MKCHEGKEEMALAIGPLPGGARVGETLLHTHSVSSGTNTSSPGTMATNPLSRLLGETCVHARHVQKHMKKHMPGAPTGLVLDGMRGGEINTFFFIPQCFSLLIV